MKRSSDAIFAPPLDVVKMSSQNSISLKFVVTGAAFKGTGTPNLFLEDGKTFFNNLTSQMTLRPIPDSIEDVAVCF